MFYHSVCQSEVFTTHTHSDTPHTHLYKTQSQKNLSWFIYRTTNHQPAPQLIGHNGGGGGGGVVQGTQDQLHLTHVCVWLTLANKGWKVAPTAYLKCIYSHYSSLSTARGCWPLLFCLNVIAKSFHKWSVCKDKHPSCTISHLQSKEHLNTCSWLPASWANTCQFLSRMTSYMPLKKQPSIVRGNKGMHMPCRDV